MSPRGKKFGGVRNRLTPWFAVCLLPLLALRGFAAEIKIEFLPPPMEGTISLGIYDATGKLVRTLHREADTDEFTVALNGLVTRWNGKDDKGDACPPGKYHARGYTVGDLKLDGVDFHGNDWVTDDDSPRITRITRIAAQADGALLVEATVPGETAPKTFVAMPVPEEPEAVPDWKLTPAPEDARFTEPAVFVRDGAIHGFGGKLPADLRPMDAVAGVEGALWVIDGESVKEFSASGELRRTLPPAPDIPPPTKLAFAPSTGTLFVLGENSEQQTLRGLNPAAPEEPLFEKGIRYSDRFEQAQPILKFSDGKPFIAVPSLKVPLVPNPLLRKGSGLAQVRVETDASGAVLTTLDGLPLARVSETANLKWAVIGRGADAKKKAATIFESDGAVIAEFKAERLDNMMAFDAGVFELPVEAPKPTPASEVPEAPEATPEAPEKAPQTATPEATAAPEPTPETTPKPALEATPVAPVH